MADASNGINFMAMLNPQFAAQQQKFALQQQLAQQMMQQGSEEPANNQLANPGGQVVQNSPWAALSRAVEKGTGAYLSNKAIGDQLAAYQTLHDQLNNSPNGNTQAQALGNGLAGNNGATNGMLNDPTFIQNAAIAGVDNATKEYIDRTKPTDLQKNVATSSTQPYVAKDTLVNTAGGYVPATSLTGTPTAPKPQATLPAPIASAVPGANPSTLSPQGNGGQVVLQNDVATRNDPALQEQRKGLISGDQKYLNETLLPAKDAATAANNNIGALQQAATIANSNDLTHTGPTAPARIGFVKHLNDFLSSTGGQPIDQNEIANADAINKIGLRLTANMTKMLGSREAAQIFTKIQEANPNWYMQPQTLNLVSNLIKGENDTAIARYNAGYQEATKPGGLAQNGVNNFDAQNPGMANVKKAFAASGMAGIDDPKSRDFQQLPSGSQFYDLIPNSPTYGKLLTKH